MKIETIYDEIYLGKEIDKIGSMSCIVFNMTEKNIRKWKQKGFFKYLKNNLTSYDFDGVMKFACAKKRLLVDNRDRVVFGCTYFFLCPTIEFANMLVDMLEKLDKGEKVSIEECSGITFNDDDICESSIGNIAECQLFNS